MKIFSSLVLATLAVAAFTATDSTDAEQVHTHRERAQANREPVVKKVVLEQPPVKLVASDLNEDDGNNGDNVRGDPFAGGPIGNVQGFDDEEPVTTARLTASEDGSRSGSSESDDWHGSNSGSGDTEDSGADGSGANEESSADGSGVNEETSSDGSGVGATTAPPASMAAYKEEAVAADDWGLFDHQSSAVGDDASHDSGSLEDDESSSSGSGAEQAESSGSCDGSGDSNDSSSDEDDVWPSNETPIGNVQGFDDEPSAPGGGWGDVTGAGETKAARAAKTRQRRHRHEEQQRLKTAGTQLATRASADNEFFADLAARKPVLLVGSAIGAAVGTLAAVMGVLHLRRQQQRDEQSTLAATLPEPQTGREDFEAIATGGAADQDELASSSIDLEEALTHPENDGAENDDDDDDDGEEGAFANGNIVV